MRKSKAEAIRRNILKISASLSDDYAWETPELFPAWQNDIDATAGERYQFGDKLYKVVQSHHTQENWKPDITPALWTEVAKPGEIPVWKQPTGSQDAYMTGDKVHYPTVSDPVYVSTIDYNTWQPDVYGWEVE